MYLLDNGWEVKKNSSNIPVLKVTPIPNTLFKKYKDVILSDEIFNDIVRGERSIKQLFKKYNLHNLIVDFTEPKTKIIPNQNSANKYYGKGFIVTQEGERFFLEYQLARQGGVSRKFEISEEIYKNARTGDYTTSEIFNKYNLYHLDIPENDIQ